MILGKFTSPEEIESFADGENERYDRERLTRCKPIDVYGYVENLLGADVEIQYITPNRSCLGITFFSDAPVYVWKRFYDPRYYDSPTEDALRNYYGPHRIIIRARKP